MPQRSCKGTSLIYACSGCSDVGELADRIVRAVTKSGRIKMSCLAGLGAGIGSFVEQAKSTCRNVAIDGCRIGCAGKTLDNMGVKHISFVLTDMGFKKGETALSDSLIKETAEKIQGSL